jgi:hypothetical protein
VNFVEALIAGEEVKQQPKRESLPSLHSVTPPDADIDEVCGILAKKCPRWVLRPYGLPDQVIPQAMKLVFQCNPIDFSMDSKSSADEAAKNILNAMAVVPLKEGVSRSSPTVSAKFFSSDPASMSSAVCLSCDHADPEAVSVSRLLGYLMSESITDAGSGASTGFNRQMSPGSNMAAAQIQKLSLVQDIDLDPQAFASMVKGSKMPAVIVLMTGGTYKSSPQLLRLGFQQQYNSAGFRPHPLAICDIFSMPDVKVVQDIQKGKVLALGSNYKAAIKEFLTEDVSFARVALALIQVLESRVFLCNCPILTERQIKETLMPSLIKVT